MTDVKVAEAPAVHGLKAAIDYADHKKDIDFFLENSTLNAKGDTLTLPQSKFEEWTASHGVARADMDRLKVVIDRAAIAKSVAAATLLEKRIKDTIEAGEDATGLKASFVTRDAVFKHTADISASRTVLAEPVKVGEEAKHKTVYGKFSEGMKIRAKLPEQLVESAAALTKKALGI